METSYNGYRAAADHRVLGGLDNRPIPGTTIKLAPGVLVGDVATVLRHVATQFHHRVEPLGEGCWGFAYRLNRNANNLSCHASGTAIDLNAPRHPNGRRGTFTAKQVATIRAILAELDGAVRWGGDFTGTPDEMHFEIAAGSVKLAAVARKLTTPTAAPPGDDMPDNATFKRLVWEVILQDDVLNAIAARVDAKQAPMRNRVMGYLRQRWYVIDGATVKEVPEGAVGARPAASLDTLDGNWLSQQITGGRLDVDALATAIAAKLATRKP